MWRSAHWRITMISSCVKNWQKNLKMELRRCMVFCYIWDRDVLGDAKEKVESSARLAGKSGKGGTGSHSSPPAAKSNKASEKPDAGKSTEVAWSSRQWSGRGARSRSPRRSDKDNRQKKDGWGSKTSKSYIAWSSKRW